MEPVPHQISLGVVIKHFGYLLAAVGAVGFESFSILATLMVIDTITGVLRVGVVHGWRHLTSHEATVGVIKKGVAIVIPIAIALAGRAVGFDLTSAARAALNVLVFSELYSILSNVQSIRLRRDVLEFDAISLLLSKVKEGLEKYLTQKAGVDDLSGK